MQDLLKNMPQHQAEPKTVINCQPLQNLENTNRNVKTLSQIAEENKINSFQDTFDDLIGQYYELR